MLTFEMIIVFLGLIGMVTALVLDKMRPGMILFSVTVLFLCFGILTPKEMLEGFSNKGMITVALLFLISEGVRQSGALGQLIKKLLPQEKTTVMKAQARMLPAISFFSAFLINELNKNNPSKMGIVPAARMLTEKPMKNPPIADIITISRIEYNTIWHRNL